ncbi:MAG: hybrid sensor histidine kinase/response regulator [Pseudomonadota bacterium]
MLKRFFNQWQSRRAETAPSWRVPSLVFAVVLSIGLLALTAVVHMGSDGLLPGLARLHGLLHLSSPTVPPSALIDDALAQVRDQVQWMMTVMCFLIAMAAGLLTHWIGVARRERLTRAVADALRDEAQAAQREAVAAGQDKAKFLGMLSHELLTPLQTILSTLSLIENRGGVDVSDPTFTRLKESTRVLRSRMSDLVDFAKLSVGQLELRVRAFTPLRLLTMLVDDYTEALLEKNLDLHWEVAESLSQRVYSDPTRIRQILENILSNAIKYTERGGISLQANVIDGVFRVELVDSGMGIAPDELVHVFDPFYRVKASAHVAVGSGLGLAVVRSLVAMLEGRIEVQSELGKGVRFLVEIPVSDRPVSRMAARTNTEERPPILVVDDDAGIRHSLADLVRTLGHEAVEVSNGRTALQECESRKFGAIFCDVQLPDLSGIEVAARIRSGQGLNQTTYLIKMSAFHEPDPRAEALFNAKLDKPLDSHQVSEVLALALSAQTD